MQHPRLTFRHVALTVFLGLVPWVSIMAQEQEQEKKDDDQLKQDLLAKPVENYHNYLLIKVSSLSDSVDIPALRNILNNQFGFVETPFFKETGAPTQSVRIADGIEFLPYLGMEVALHYFGSERAEAVGPTDDEMSVRREGFGGEASLFGQYPLGKRFTVYAKAGFLYWRLNSKIDTPRDGFSGDIHEDDFDLIYGAGVRFDINSRMFLDASYEEMDYDVYSLDMVSVGLGIRY